MLRPLISLVTLWQQWDKSVFQLIKLISPQMIKTKTCKLSWNFSRTEGPNSMRNWSEETHSCFATNSTICGFKNWTLWRHLKEKCNTSTSITKAQKFCQSLSTSLALVVIKMTSTSYHTLRTSRTLISWRLQSSSEKWAKLIRMKCSSTNTGMWMMRKWLKKWESVLRTKILVTFIF